MIEAEIKFADSQDRQAPNSTPWLTERTRSVVNPILRFHNEIIDFAEYVAPTHQEHEAKLRLFQAIETHLQTIAPSSTLLSPLFRNKLYLKGTELELFILTQTDSNQWTSLALQIQAAAGLTSYSMSAEQVQPSGDMRVICMHAESGLQVWMTFVPDSWRAFLVEAESLIPEVPELRYLFFINWCMVRQRNLHSHIKSLLVFGLCSFFMFERRKQRSRTLSENFIKFLEFFGVGSAHERRIIYRQGKAFDCSLVPEQRSFNFQISEGINISSNSMRDYFKLIQNRYRVVGNFFYVPGSSIVTHLVNPCQGEFFF